MGDHEKFPIEIVYATPNEQTLIGLCVLPGSTIESAIAESGILDQFPDIDLKIQPVGIFNQRSSLQHRLSVNDRIEIYRFLSIDPKDARRVRHKKK